jgi:hypothetical protein
MIDLGDARVTRSAARPIAILLLLAAAGGGAYYYLGVVRPRAAAHTATADAGPPPAARAEIGWIAVDSDPPGAAVWVEIGPTPAVSLPVDPTRSYLVRVEHDGYQARDVVVKPEQFTPVPGGGAAVQADLAVELPTASARTPRAAEPTAMPSPASGTTGATRLPPGRIRVTSTPPAATAWLLVAVTPGRVGPVATSSRPSLRIAASGRLPSFVTVEPGGFTASGEGRLSTSLPPLSPPPGGGTR